MSINQGKYKPSVCAIDEVDDRNLKHDDLHKQQIEGSETAPLTINQQKLHIDDSLAAKDVESQKGKGGVAGNAGGIQTGTAAGANSGNNGSINGIRGFLVSGRLSFDALMRLSRKRRILYICTACLCAILLVIIFLMISLWPEVPFYLKAKLCLDKECVEASKQILLWANTSKNPCHDTYAWACGNFAQEYADNDYYVIKRGEWNYKAYNEYQELNELNRFISMFPSSGVSYSDENMISVLYKACREIDTLDKSNSDLLLRKAINDVGNLQSFLHSNSLQFWDHKKSLVYLQTVYGIFPYYKVSVENRFNKPHDYIITLDEGEVGLPDKYFYDIDQNDEIVRGYKSLLRDFAIYLGLDSREANLFADDIYHYETRIVKHIEGAKSLGKNNSNEIKTLAEMKTIAPSLPIFETLQKLFPHTKIAEETEVLVRNVEVFHQLSTVIATSDKKPINNFIIWSLARHFLPHLSQEYRTLVDNFDHVVYGRTASYPRWMICAKIVRDWLPFAVDALQQNQNQLKATQAVSKHTPVNPVKHPNKTLGNDEILRLMYYSLRNQLQRSVEEAKWIDPDLKEYINEKLTTMRVQIGIPEEALGNKSYIKDYYSKLLTNSLYFVEYLESIWTFRKARMEEKLRALNIVDNIISEMYANEEPKAIAYSNILNMLVISHRIAISKYYDYRYPVPVNFARVGADILEVLIHAISTFVEQFKAERNLNSSESSNDAFDLAKVVTACITSDDEMAKTDLSELSEETLKSFHITLSAAKITAKALSSFIRAIDSADPITGSSIDPNLTYESLGLTQRLRVPGLRSLNENELFTIAYMQKHCSSSIADKDYARIKPHVEQELAEQYLFTATWKHIQFLPRSWDCSVPNPRCSKIL